MRSDSFPAPVPPRTRVSPIGSSSLPETSPLAAPPECFCPQHRQPPSDNSAPRKPDPRKPAPAETHRNNLRPPCLPDASQTQSPSLAPAEDSLAAATTESPVRSASPASSLHGRPLRESAGKTSAVRPA